MAAVAVAVAVAVAAAAVASVLSAAGLVLAPPEAGGRLLGDRLLSSQ